MGAYVGLVCVPGWVCWEGGGDMHIYMYVVGCCVSMWVGGWEGLVYIYIWVCWWMSGWGLGVGLY